MSVLPPASTVVRYIALMLLLVAGSSAQEADSRAAVRRATPAAVAKATGHYYALVIGIDDYPPGLKKLKTAVHDAEEVAQVLQERYGFTVKLLRNEQATRLAILQAMIDYQALADENDSVLIYYAGHGFSDESANKSYWLPVDANSSLSPNRIIADDLTQDIRAMRAKHVLVISDSCYSGGLSRGVDTPVLPSKDLGFLRKMMGQQSRHLMASGGEEPVADSGPGGHSVFAAALLKSLNEADGPMFSASSIFYDSVMPLVAVSAAQIPQYAPIRNSSSRMELGDFIFTVKGASVAAGSRPANTNSSGGTRGAGDEDPYDRAAALNEDKQYGEAAPLFEKSCGLGNVRSCNAIGYMYFNGRGVSKDQAKAFGFYQTACAANNPSGCTNLGFMYATGAIVEKDPTKAAPLYQKGCDAGSAAGCRNLGSLYESGRGFAVDKRKAVALYSRACVGGSIVGCSDLGDMYQDGTGIGVDKRKAADLYLKACDGGYGQGCTNLGDMFQDGVGVSESPGKAAEFYGRGCAIGDADGCKNLGEMYLDGDGIEASSTKAAEFYRKACDLKDAESCQALKTLKR